MLLIFLVIIIMMDALGLSIRDENEIVKMIHYSFKKKREDSLWWCIAFLFQEPRPVSQSDLERVISTTTKTNIAAIEFSRLSSQSLGWSQQRESDDYQVQAAISELSKLVVSQILNLQSGTQEP